MKVYQNRNLAREFFKSLGFENVVRLTQNPEGNLAWKIVTDGENYHFSEQIGQCVNMNKNDDLFKNKYRIYSEIAPNEPFIFENEIYLYKMSVRTPKNIWIYRMPIIFSSEYIKQIFSKTPNLSVKFFEITQNKKLINHVWALYSNKDMVFYTLAFQDGPKECNTDDYDWNEIQFEQEFTSFDGRLFFLHTQKGEPCIREISI